ncbi:MAG: tetratricopeptide repeat protein [Candidatus Eutrophobiaceae bacterium]
MKALFSMGKWSVFTLLSLLAISFSAADLSAARQKDKTQATGAIDAKTFDVLIEAQQKTQDGEYAEALKLLDSVRDSDKLNSYARTQVWNFYAYIYASQERYRQAINAYKKVLAEPDAPEGLKLTSKYTLAQLYFQIEDYPAVIQLMEEWLSEVEKPTVTAFIMLAQAHYQSHNWDQALSYMDKAIASAAQKGEKPKENWLRVKSAIHFEKNDLPAILASYEELMRYYPRIVYLRQIAGLHGELGNERKRIATFDAIYEHGAFESENDLLNLAYMYLGQQVPYKAGLIIEEGMKAKKIKATLENMEMLASTWAQANEHKKAIPALKRAAKLSEKGILYARLAGVYFDAGKFKRAAEAASEADEKGGLKHAENNQMLRGMALFNIKEYEQALQAFRQARKSKKLFSDARKWEKYTLSEIERLKAIKEIAHAARTAEILEAQGKQC